MIYSSLDIHSRLKTDPVIGSVAQVFVTKQRPELNLKDGLHIYVQEKPVLDEFKATWNIWIINHDDIPLEWILQRLQRVLPAFAVKSSGAIIEAKTTEIKTEKTDTVKELKEKAIGDRISKSLQKQFDELVESINDRMLLVGPGRPGKDGRDGVDGRPGRDGTNGRDGRDIYATETSLFDLADVEEGIEKKKGQVLTYDGDKWTNLFVPQLISSISGKGGTSAQALDDLTDVDTSTASPTDGQALVYDDASGQWIPGTVQSGSSLPDGDYTNQPLTWNGTAWTGGATVQLDTTNVTDPIEGQLAWEQDEHTAVLGLNGVHAHLAHDTYAWCRNATGSTIPKGAAVMFAGTLGASGRILIAPMVADGTYPGYVFLGVTAEAVPTDTDGPVISYGKLKGINTSLLSEGAILWCDPATPGGLTVVEPSAPSLKLPVAAVISSKNNGTLMVRWATGSRLQDLHDVQVSAPSDGQALTWNSTNGRWEPKTITGTSGVEEAPLDGNFYVRQNGVWIDLQAAIDILATRVIDGGNFTTGTSDGDDSLVDGGIFS